MLGINKNLTPNIDDYNSLDTICITGKFTVKKYNNKWNFEDLNLSKHEEIKGYICWFTDNLRLISNKRMQMLSNKYRSWNSIYFRHQDSINEHIINTIE